MSGVSYSVLHKQQAHLRTNSEYYDMTTTRHSHHDYRLTSWVCKFLAYFDDFNTNYFLDFDNWVVEYSLTDFSQLRCALFCTSSYLVLQSHLLGLLVER